jgi:FtsP/CotA-like multicopper oxidase with cupredoxin domain
MRLCCCLLGLLAALAVTDAAAGEPAKITTHDNFNPAGRLQDGVLSLALYAGLGAWYPEGDSSRPWTIAAFGEDGKPLTVPSPLIRVPAGTTVHASVRNTLTLPLRVHGLCERPGICEPITVLPGETREFQFALKIAGTFSYTASTTSLEAPVYRLRDDSQLGGAIVVDAPSADLRDRLFVLGLIKNKQGFSEPEITVINGRSWPHTERLRHAVGDEVHWRVLNLSRSPHAMHLHGFYFDVESTGDGIQDTVYADADRRRVVTEYMPAGRTMTLSWIPERPGNWLFHCHMLQHMMPSDELHGGLGAAHTHDAAAAGMSGLVLGIEVTGDGRSDAVHDSARRKLRLIVEADDRHGNAPAYKVGLVASPPAPRVGDRAVPGPVMVLARGEPVTVEIENRLNEPTAIHWHGIELESYDDGVPGYGATAGRVTPPVDPGGTFTARFTPSRAGTFIYHTHWHNSAQLSAGIYGPLIVLEAGQTWDPVTDHLVVLGLDGPNRPRPDEPFVVNGDSKPRPLELKAGVAHRLRIINITPENTGLVVQLLSRLDLMQWTPVGKDGAELPTQQRNVRAARQQVAVGETYDFELAPMEPRPEGFGLWMELRRSNGELLFQWPVRVRLGSD